MRENLKILIVDDTDTYRQILSEAIEKIPYSEVSGTAPNGKIALQKIRTNKPDLVLMDIFMPVMDGLETLKRLKADYPDIEVVMVSGCGRNNADTTMNALKNGALDFIPKPDSISAEKSIKILHNALFPIVSLVINKKTVRKIRELSFTKTGNSIIPKPAPSRHDRISDGTMAPSGILNKRRTGPISVVALGVSTGGPKALSKVIPKIKTGLRVPILAVQHMPPEFTASLAASLDKSSNINVLEGKEGQIIERGKMYIAPGGYHMVVRKGAGNNLMLGLNTSPPVNSCRPSVDVLLRSVNMAFPGTVLTVILTGMGNDGTDGVAAIRRRGGYSIVQDEKTSVVWGMPSAVAGAGEADEILPLEKIAGRISEIVEKGAG